MMSRSLLFAVSIAFISGAIVVPVAGTKVIQNQRESIPLDPVELRYYRQGIGMFAIDWETDPGEVRFNATACGDCHRSPSLGGTTRDINQVVRMMPDDNVAAGYSADQRLLQLKSGEVEKRPAAIGHELRRTPVLFGIGLLEAIADADIRAKADPEDLDKDGISGRTLNIGGKIGRFGWKAAVPTIEDFCRAAFLDELGVSTTPRYKGHEISIDMNQVRRTALFLRHLPAPKSKPQPPNFETGKRLFSEIGCASCHTPNHKTQANSPVQFRNVEFSPYTDLLLHDLGPGPAQSGTARRASRREYRTPPLWGIGTFKGPYWHDASVKTIQDAIMRHEGEAMKVRTKYEALDESNKQTILQFVESL